MDSLTERFAKMKRDALLVRKEIIAWSYVRAGYPVERLQWVMYCDDPYSFKIIVLEPEALDFQI